MDTEIVSAWNPQTEILTTRLTGDVSAEDVAQWQAGLQDALAQIEEGGSFKFLSNLVGYELQDMAAHKAMRGVIPQMLLAYGLRTTLFNLFPEVQVQTQQTRGIVCRAVANVHHDADKMGEYERTLSSAQERFFTDAQAALEWLRSLD